MPPGSALQRLTLLGPTRLQIWRVVSAVLMDIVKHEGHGTETFRQMIESVGEKIMTAALLWRPLAHGTNKAILSHSGEKAHQAKRNCSSR